MPKEHDKEWIANAKERLMALHPTTIWYEIIPTKTQKMVYRLFIWRDGQIVDLSPTFYRALGWSYNDTHFGIEMNGFNDTPLMQQTIERFLDTPITFTSITRE